jgi:hypothetical protein
MMKIVENFNIETLIRGGEGRSKKGRVSMRRERMKRHDLRSI